MNNISRETFEQMDTDSKLNVLFDYAVDANKIAKIAHEISEGLDKKINKGHKVDMLIAGMMGFVGGLVGFLGTSYTNLVRR